MVGTKLFHLFVCVGIVGVVEVVVHVFIFNSTFRMFRLLYQFIISLNITLCLVLSYLMFIIAVIVFEMFYYFDTSNQYELHLGSNHRNVSASIEHIRSEES